MKLLNDILHVLQLAISFPVNAIIWFWNQPRRGRCLLWGMPAVLVLLCALLVSIWARTGLKNELTNAYKSANKKNQDEIDKLADAIAKSDSAKAELAKAQSVPTESAAVESANRLDGETLVAGDETVATSLKTEAEELAERAVFQIRRNIRLRDIGTEVPRSEAVFELRMLPDGRIDEVKFVRGSGDSLWESDVEDGIRKTARLEFEDTGPMPDALELSFERSEILLDRHELASQIYLRKLIELNPNELQFKYDLAMSLFESGNWEQSYSLMTQVAPEDKPGLADGHVWLAETLYKNPSYGGDAGAARLKRITRHLEYALRSEPEHFEANFGMAQILYLQKRFKDAAVHLERLFDNSTNLKALGVTSLMVRVYRATGEEQKLSERLQEIENRLREFWKGNPESDVFAYDLCRVYEYRNRYQDAIDLLNSRTNDDNRELINRTISHYYFRWSRWLQTQPNITAEQIFDKLKTALQYDPRNEAVLTVLAMLGVSNDEFRDAALALYDPIADGENAPALVLRELASHKILAGETELARSLLEKSYARAPHDPVTANNLAFLLLAGDAPDPERSLKMVDDALRSMRRNQRNDRMLVSSLLDTRASAMIQLQRFQEAIANLQAALQLRPGEVKFMKTLRDCYLAVHLTELADKMERDIEAAIQKSKTSTEPKIE